MSQAHLTRRDFLTFSAAAVALLNFPGCATLAQNPRKPRPIAPGAKIRIAQIGCGGKGYSDVMPHKDAEEIVALCDIDWEGLPRPSQPTKEGAAKKEAKKADTKGATKQTPNVPNVKKLQTEFPNAKRYTDFRKMLLEMDDQIDAVIVSTPDHMHFLPAYMAIMLGKHVYVQKPLTQTVGEARELLRLARMNGVVTQMGNQGHAGEGIRLVKEWITAGLLGEVREVHVWTNRPIWPQGFQEWPKEDPKPANIDWEAFIGRQQMRPFSRQIHPFSWRGYQDYGCGALGDMACHLMDASYWGLDLGAPTSVELKKIVDPSKVAFPKQAIVEYQFPARGSMPPVKLTWYEGGLKPEKPKEMGERNFNQGGQLIVGSKATVYDGTDYCISPRIIPESLHQELGTSGKFPPKTIPRVFPGTPEAGSPYKEWSAAIRAGNPKGCGSNFEYSVPFTETVALGTMAILLAEVGKKFTWDGKAMKTNLPEADALLYPNYRAGWTKEEVLKGAKLSA